MRLVSARNLLTIVRQQTDVIGVAFSAGKDSSVVLDLCCEMFPRVEAFYMQRVPNLEVIARVLHRTRHRYGIEIQVYPHFDLSRLYRHAVLQPHWVGVQWTPRITMADIEDHFRRERGLDWCAFGWRMTDSLHRMIILKSNRGFDPRARRVFPIWSWTRRDVLAYLRQKRIPLPPSFGRLEQGGVDFHPETLRYLRERYPDDYRRLLQSFPFAEAQTTAIRRGDRTARRHRSASA